MDFERICRICLNERECYLRIYQKQFDYDSLLYEIVNDVCQLEIKLQDGLPEFICSECGQKIQEFHTFKKKAHCSRTMLENMKQSTENEENPSAVDEPMSVAVQRVLPPNIKIDVTSNINTLGNISNKFRLPLEENPSSVREPTPVAVQRVLPQKLNIDVTNNNITSGNISNKFRLPLLILRSDGALVPSTAGQIELRSSNFRSDGKPSTIKAGIAQSPNIAERSHNGGEVNCQAHASNSSKPDGTNELAGKISIKRIESLMDTDKMEDTICGITSSESTLINKRAKSNGTFKHFMVVEELSNKDDGDVVSVDDVGNESEEYDGSMSSTSQENDSDDVYVPDDDGKIQKFKPVPFELKVKIVNMAKKNPNWRLSTLQKNGCRKLRYWSQLKHWIKQVEGGGNQAEKYEMIRKITLDKYMEAVRNNKSVTSKTIKKWALTVARKHFPHNCKFRASETWLSNLKREFKMRQQMEASDTETERS